MTNEKIYKLSFVSGSMSNNTFREFESMRFLGCNPGGKIVLARERQSHKVVCLTPIQFRNKMQGLEMEMKRMEDKCFPLGITPNNLYGHEWDATVRQYEDMQKIRSQLQSSPEARVGYFGQAYLMARSVLRI